MNTAVPGANDDVGKPAPFSLQDIANYRKEWRWYLKFGVVIILGISIFLSSTPTLTIRVMNTLERRNIKQYQQVIALFGLIVVTTGLAALVVIALAKLLAILPPEPPSDLIV